MRRGLSPSRERARADIAAGRVTVGGAPADKPSRLVDAGEAVLVHGPGPRFVSRAGAKLEAAIERFGLDPVFAGARVLDAGASTGGFTDCALQHGAAHVVAVDVGHNQLHERLAADDRVDSRERTNLRTIDPATLGPPVGVVVGDLSFISLTLVLDRLVAASLPGAVFVLLVKPQFEAGREEVARGRGVVRDPEVWRRVLGSIASALTDRSAAIMGAMASPLTGSDGNVEFVLVGRFAGGPDDLVGRRALAAGPLEAALDVAVAESPVRDLPGPA